MLPSLGQYESIRFFQSENKLKGELSYQLKGDPVDMLKNTDDREHEFLDSIQNQSTYSDILVKLSVLTTTKPFDVKLESKFAKMTFHHPFSSEGNTDTQLCVMPTKNTTYLYCFDEEGYSDTSCNPKIKVFIRKQSQ